MLNIADALRQQPVGALALRPPVTVDVDSGLEETLAVMRAEKSSYALVLERNRLVGIFTERDLLMRGIGPGGVPGGVISEYMTRAPLVLKASDSVASAVAPMVAGACRHLPIVDDHGSPLGVLDIHDIFLLLAEFMPTQLLNLPPRPHRPMSETEGA